MDFMDADLHLLEWTAYQSIVLCWLIPNKTDLWSMDFDFSWKCQFSGHFFKTNSADIEMKLSAIGS
jgi:hypothetical protein